MYVASTAIDGATFSKSMLASCGLPVGVSEDYRRGANTFGPPAANDDSPAPSKKKAKRSREAANAA